MVVLIKTGLIHYESQRETDSHFGLTKCGYVFSMDPAFFLRFKDYPGILVGEASEEIPTCLTCISKEDA